MKYCNNKSSNCPKKYKKSLVKITYQFLNTVLCGPQNPESLTNFRVFALYPGYFTSKQKGDYGKDLSINIKQLLRFPPEPYTFPSQTTLDLIVNNLFGKSIFTESIGQLFLESKNELLLKPLKDNIIVHSNEEALKHMFLDTLILTLHADFEPVNWQEATRVSLPLMKKSEEKILNLKISDQNRPNQKTVREALELKISKKCNAYLEPLMKRNDADLKCMFVVGLYRLISRKVYCADINQKCF
ncbi:hypothetical protein Glove_140g24 [Diversispora epigaea]|uniref:Uncharacterized protein n=1 Tax=Diversispora epigaea TaxID=1348612 RepID=A0A397J1F7_9GLOM|nr:hypothetical protein Glove_140g24 [Diversispora epigaea]